MLNKITPEELAGVGVIGLADAPRLGTEEMQRKFEETAREVIVPKFNELVEALAGENGATEIGAQDPATGENVSVQRALDALLEYVNQKIIAIGAGDMQKAVYDPQGKAKDIFAEIAGVEGALDGKIAATNNAVSATDAKFSGCWISFWDQDGNPTDEPYIHWMQEV